MSKSITVRITKNYGQEAIYPADDQAELFAQLLDRKTFSRWQLTQIKKLGYEINVLAPALELA